MKQARHQEWWALGSVGTRRCGSAHIGMRSAGSPGEAVVRRSRVGREERSSRGQKRLLLKHLVLERVALGTHSLAQCLDEGRVKLRQGSAVAG